VAKVTSKLQVTIPKALAERFGIRPGDEITWEPAGDAIRIVPAAARPALALEDRLRLFDEATARQQRRNRRSGRARGPGTGRGWTRDELYTRGGAR
jgi:AbrB family looped-hinge helix DNA binding protein